MPASQGAESSNGSPPARSTTRVAGDNYDDIFCFLEDFGVLVCKEHCSGVVNLDRHLLEQHKTPVNERKEIVQRFAQYERKEPKDVELPEQPACVFEELGTPLDGFHCKICEFLTININAIRIHLKKNHLVYDATWIGSPIHPNQVITHPDPKTRVCNADQTPILAHYSLVRIGPLISAL